MTLRCLTMRASSTARKAGIPLSLPGPLVLADGVPQVESCTVGFRPCRGLWPPQGSAGGPAYHGNLWATGHPLCGHTDTHVVRHTCRYVHALTHMYVRSYAHSVPISCSLNCEIPQSLYRTCSSVCFYDLTIDISCHNQVLFLFPVMQREIWTYLTSHPELLVRLLP